MARGWYEARAYRPRIAGAIARGFPRGPCPGVDRMQEAFQQPIVFAGLLEIDGVAAIRHHHQAGRGISFFIMMPGSRQAQSSSPVMISVGAVILAISVVRS